MIIPFVDLAIVTYPPFFSFVILRLRFKNKGIVCPSLSTLLAKIGISNKKYEKKWVKGLNYPSILYRRNPKV